MSMVLRVFVSSFALVWLAACTTAGPQAPVALPSRPPTKPMPAPSATDVLQAQQASNLGQVRELQEKQQHLAALAHLKQHTNRWGPSAETRFLQAESLRATGQDQEAATLYQGLLTGETAGQAYRGLGLMAAQRGDIASAVAALEKAAQLRPTDPLVLSDLGYALLLADRVTEARWPLMTALQLAPTDPKFQANVALYLYRSGAQADAERLLSSSNLPDATRQVIRRQGQTIMAPHTPLMPLSSMRLAPYLGSAPASP